MFQRELQHFTNNLEYYIKNSALKQCCTELNKRISGLGSQNDQARDPSASHEAVHQDDSLGIDMDKLVQIHKEFLSQVVRRCMLHPKFKYMRRELGNVMSCVLEFRKVCVKYLLSKPSSDAARQMPGSAETFSNAPDWESDDEDVLLSDGGRTGISNRKRIEQEGMGLLKVQSPEFMANLKLCSQELKTLRQRFNLTMEILMRALALTENKAGEIKHLNEAFIRFNFNYFYMKRQD